MDRYERLRPGDHYVLDRRTGEVHQAKPDDLGLARLKASTVDLVTIVGFLVVIQGRGLLHRARRLVGRA